MRLVITDDDWNVLMELDGDAAAIAIKYWAAEQLRAGISDNVQEAVSLAARYEQERVESKRAERTMKRMERVKSASARSGL